MYRVCNIVERKLPGQLFHYRQFIFASPMYTTNYFSLLFFQKKKKTITSVRLSIVDRLFNCLNFFAVILIENKYRLRFGTRKIQIFVETHKKSSSYKLSTLSSFFPGCVMKLSSSIGHALRSVQAFQWNRKNRISSSTSLSKQKFVGSSTDAFIFVVSAYFNPGFFSRSL